MSRSYYNKHACLLRNFVFYLFAGLISVLFMPSIANAQHNSGNAQIVDSLFILASSGDTKDRDFVEPSKQAIIEMGAAAIPQMLTKLETHDAREMHAIVDIFKGIGETAVESLTTRIYSQDSFIRRLAIRCLGEIKSEKAVGALAAIKDHDDFRTRSKVMTALGMIGSPDGSYTVMQGLSDPDDLVATAAAVACGKIKAGIKPNVLVKALSHPYYGVRHSAANSLAELGEIAVNPLLDYVQSQPTILGLGYVVQAMGRVDSPDVVPTLTLMLTSIDWSIRANSAEALGNFKSQKTVNTLKQALKNEKHPLVIYKIKLSLDKLQTD